MRCHRSARGAGDAGHLARAFALTAVTGRYMSSSASTERGLVTSTFRAHFLRLCMITEHGVVTETLEAADAQQEASMLANVTDGFYHRACNFWPSVLNVSSACTARGRLARGSTPSGQTRQLKALATAEAGIGQANLWARIHAAAADGGHFARALPDVVYANDYASNASDAFRRGGCVHSVDAGSDRRLHVVSSYSDKLAATQPRDDKAFLAVARLVASTDTAQEHGPFRSLITWQVRATLCIS